MDFLKLTGSQARLVEPHKNWPIDAFVIYAIEDDKILGRVAIIVLPHIENLEVEDNNKNGFLMKELLEEAESVLKSFNRTCAASFIMNDNLKAIDYAKRLGYEKLPAEVYIKPLA